MLDLYSDYLLSSFGPATGTGLSRMLEGAISHDRIQRFLAGSAKGGAALWKIVKPYVRELQSESGVMIVDDSISEKPHTDENEIICWHYDHTSGETVNRVVSPNDAPLSRKMRYTNSCCGRWCRIKFPSATC